MSEEDKSESVESPEEVTEEDVESSERPIIIFPPGMPGTQPPKPEMRVLALIGDVEEEKSGEIIYGLLALRETGRRPADPEDENSKEEYEPIQMIVSTFGGSASDMFAIYDIMRTVRDDCEIHTYGIGKVMSAGVLLLAAGSKGKRKIGKHCRVMLHSVAGGTHGELHSLENEMDEIRWIQEQYINALVKETDLTKRMLKKLLDRKVNVYLDAREAVEYGIADIIV